MLQGEAARSIAGFAVAESWIVANKCMRQYLGQKRQVSLVVALSWDP
jgi:hypothetical protein